MNKQLEQNYIDGIKILRATKQKNFCMSEYRKERTEQGPFAMDVLFFSQKKCGTIGCSLGTIAAKGKGRLAPIRDDFILDSNSCLDFTKYCRRVFGLSYDSDCWNFLFDAIWEDYDNTPQGAADRMEFFLENNLHIRDDWRYTNYEEGWKERLTNKGENNEY